MFPKEPSSSMKALMLCGSALVLYDDEERNAEIREYSFDELAKGLAGGTISRGRALRLLGSALLGGVLASIPGVALAAPCPSGQTKCGKECCSGGENCVKGGGAPRCVCPTQQECGTQCCRPNELCCTLDLSGTQGCAHDRAGLPGNCFSGGFIGRAPLIHRVAEKRSSRKLSCLEGVFSETGLSSKVTKRQQCHQDPQCRSDPEIRHEPLQPSACVGARQTTYTQYRP